MSRFLNISAQALSIVLYPLFVPTYGMVLFCYTFHTQVAPMPFIWTLLAVLGTFLLTCILPVTAIWMLVRKGEVSDMQIADARERTVPYVYTTVGFGFWSYLLIGVLRAPACLGYVAVGATVAIATVTLVNRWWKISAHLTGFGGLFGGLLCVCIGTGICPSWGLLASCAGLAFVLMCARLYLRVHTDLQVSAGWLLGLICTAVPYCIHSYVV